MTDKALRTLVDLRQRVVQKTRIAFGNRISAIESGEDEADPRTLGYMQEYHDEFQELEERLDDQIKDEADKYDIVKHFSTVKGVSHITAAKIIAHIDIRRSDTVSSLWRYAGYAVIDGEAERPTKGEKLHYNKRLKTACYQMGESLLRARSPYATEYYESKEYYREERDWTKLHVHYAAMRKMVKLALSHLWHRWRQLEGLPTRATYVEQHLGHDDITQPVDFGWCDVGEQF